MDSAQPPARINGYRGIWYALGFKFEYGDKYTGGLGTYTANHQPMAVYAPAVRQTFFVYGGTPSESERQLVIMVGLYDHQLGTVSRPVAVHLDPGVDDPHDNACLQIDPAGYVWIFKSGRNTTRPGMIYRSRSPYSIEAFEVVDSWVFTYPQLWHDPVRGFFLAFTRYTGGRELYWRTSVDGVTWSEIGKLAGFDGHYQVSGLHEGKFATFFNWHPGGDNDQRTNVYYAQTTDFGRTWTTAHGQPLSLPLDSPANGALIYEYHSLGLCVYTCDLNFDRHGNPILLFVVSRAGEPGPKGDPREWVVMHWKDNQWRERIVTRSDHNYDMGSLYVEGSVWRVVGPTESGPQPYATGGEVVQWVSLDEGQTWGRGKQLTTGSRYNHSYVRRPLRACDPFYTFWADGDAHRISPSHLYFADQQGNQVWQLPYEMPFGSQAPRPLIGSPAEKQNVSTPTR